MSDKTYNYLWYNESEVAQLCLTLCNPVDCSPPGFSVHGVFQARILEWVAISFSRASSPPRDRTQVSCIGGRCFTLWATREAIWYIRWSHFITYIFKACDIIVCVSDSQSSSILWAGKPMCDVGRKHREHHPLSLGIFLLHLHQLTIFMKLLVMRRKDFWLVCLK